MQVMIILSGNPPSSELINQISATTDFIIAADGGARTLPLSGIEPNLVVGDFDSVRPESLPSHWKVKLETDQFTTDFEKALTNLPTRDPDSIVILGGLGGRIDHELTNLLIASRIPSVIPVKFIADDCSIYRITTVFQHKFPVGDTVSLIPWNQATNIRTRGLKWELQGQNMNAASQLGQSNEVVNSLVQIEISTGIIYFVHNHGSPPE